MQGAPHTAAVHPAETPLLLASDADGADRRSLARSVARGVLVRVARGVYVESTAWRAAGASGQHFLRMRALDRTAAERPRFSHWSAAVAHDLPVPQDALQQLHRTDPAPHAERSGLRTHTLPLAGLDLVERHGLVTTAVARTVIDVAAIASFRDAVALADAGLRLLGSEAAGSDDGSPALGEAWQRAQPRRAARRVQRVLDFADGRAESVGESVSRVTMAELGLPMPVLQQPFSDADGRIGTVDFWWPALGVIGEFDGRIKYFDPGMTGGDPAEVLYREKRREDRLRALGPRIVRWGWPEAINATRLGPRLAAVGVRP